MPLTKRSFRIEFNGNTFSRLISRTPRQAAQKAVLRMAKKYEEGTMPNTYKANDWNTFKVIETTRGSHKRTFEYRGVRKTLDKPIEAKIAGKVILCKYDTEVYANKKTKVTTSKTVKGGTKKTENAKSIDSKPTKRAPKAKTSADTKVVAKAPKRTGNKKSTATEKHSSK
jgi:hypothetical protein